MDQVNIISLSSGDATFADFNSQFELLSSMINEATEESILMEHSHFFFAIKSMPRLRSHDNYSISLVASYYPSPIIQAWFGINQLLCYMH